MCDAPISHPWNYYSYINTSNNDDNFHYQNENNLERFSVNYQNISHYYNLENVPRPKNFFCDVCSKSFYSNKQYKKHIDEHIECPYPECTFKGSVKYVDQHISNLHMLVNAESIYMDIKTYNKERYKKFPSKQRADLQLVVNLEKNKRGERLNRKSSKFANRSANKVKFVNKGANKDKRSSEFFRKDTKDKVPSGKDNSKKEFNKYNKKFNKDKLDKNEIRKDIKFKNVIVENKINEEDIDSEVRIGIPTFKGTKAFYESIGEVSLFGFESNFCEEVSSRIDISDDDDEWRENVITEKTEKYFFQNALGSLMAAYDSESDTEMNCENIASQTSTIPLKEEQANTTVIETQLKENKFNVNTNFKNKRKRYKPYRKNKKDKLIKRDLHTKFKPKKYRRRSLLQNILEPEMVHERNAILQCVRYIVNHNFFESEIENINKNCQADNSKENDQTEDISREDGQLEIK